MGFHAFGMAGRIFLPMHLPVLLAGFLVGPLAGVLAGMDWAAELGAQHVVSVAADTPFFPRDLVARLERGLAAAPIALAASRDPERGVVRQPTFGLWPVSLRDDLRRALDSGVRKVVLWTDVHGTSEVLFEASDGLDPFFNVNTPAELEAARDRYARDAV